MTIEKVAGNATASWPLTGHVDLQSYLGKSSFPSGVAISNSVNMTARQIDTGSLLIKRIGQFLNCIFASCDLHNWHTGDLANAADQILIVCSHGINAMLRDLYTYPMISRLYKPRNKKRDKGDCRAQETHSIHYTIICICPFMITLQSRPSRIFRHPQRQPVLGTKLFKFCNRTICEAWNTLRVQPNITAY